MRKRGEDDKHALYVEGLTPEEHMLIVLRDELYNGSWDLMIEDLKDRLQGRPYIFKLANRIEEDMERVVTLKTYESEHKVNLGAYLPVRGS